MEVIPTLQLITDPPRTLQTASNLGYCLTKKYHLQITIFYGIYSTFWSLQALK